MLRVWRRRRLARNILFTVCAVYEPANMRKMIYGTLLKLIELCILGLNWKRIFGELSVLVMNYYQTHMTYSKRSSLQWTRLLGLLDSVGGYESHLSDRLEFHIIRKEWREQRCVTTPPTHTHGAETAMRGQLRMSANGTSVF